MFIHGYDVENQLDKTDIKCMIDGFILWCAFKQIVLIHQKVRKVGQRRIVSSHLLIYLTRDLNNPMKTG
jgi:hypothetical protein